MPAPASPPLRFLLRGSAFFILLLALWWWVLLPPMLAILRISTSGILYLLPGGRVTSGVTVTPDGWMVRVPVPEFLGRTDAVQRAYGRAPGSPPVKVRSFQLGIAKHPPIFFMLGFPLYWALLLASPRSRNLGSALGIGTVLLAAIAQLSLLYYVGYTLADNLKVPTPRAIAAILDAIEYMNTSVIPYLAPLLIAPWLHEGLRAQIFSWGGQAEFEPAPVVTEGAEKSQRGRYRRK